MFTKSLIAAGAIAASLAVAAPAQADVGVDIDVTVGGGYGYEGYFEPPYWHGYNHGAISCHRGGNIVRNHNFRNVRAVDCHLPGYRYIGWKQGKKFVIRLNGAGHITSVSRVF